MKISHNASLAGLNSLGVPCTAEELVIVDCVDELRDALDYAGPITLLGGGSNVVLRRLIRGRVVKLAIRGIEFERTAAESWLVTAGAGEQWHELVRASLGRGIAGLENLALIPGSVGAAPYQNIGAYGRELASLVATVEVMDRATGLSHELDEHECRFRYRDSRFKSDDAGRYAITRITLRLGSIEPDARYADIASEIAAMGRGTSALNVAEAVTRVRRRKLPDPRRVGNVGSFFKNPILEQGAYEALRDKLDIAGFADGVRIKVSAARLLDDAGWKGRVEGAAAVWHRQPLVLINRGGASGADVLGLASRIADDVQRRYDVSLELEPIVLGED